jgi:hypothetical protein
MQIDLTGLVTAEQKASQAARAEQERINAEARQYLDSTDWYVTRHRETGAAIPEDVLLARQAARERVVEVDDESPTA